jgi:hypothetical protein
MPQPPLVLDPLSASPLPPGLFSVAGGIHDLPVHGENNGAIWLPDSCSPAELAPTQCQAPPYTQFAMDSQEPLAQAWPFAVYASTVTGAFGLSNDEAVRRVKQRLLNFEQNLAEKALWGGTATLFTLQQDFAGTTPGTAGGVGVAGVAGGIFQQMANVGAPAGFFDLGTAVTVAEGVSLLEQSAAANYYGQAIVHARPRLATFFGRSNLIRVVGLTPRQEVDHIYTQNLNPVNFGNGYAGTGPANQAVVETPVTGTEYIWATGRVIVWRSPEIWVSPPDQLLNRNNNQRGLYAFRNYMVGVECFAACVQVTRV